MVVVVIVAVLATVATVAYVRHIRKGRLVSGRAFIAAIQARQEAYLLDYGSYCDVTGGNPCPTEVPTKGDPVPWNPGACAAPQLWTILGARPEAGVTYFQYVVKASTASDGHALDAMAQSLGVPVPQGGVAGRPWYYVIAKGDLSGSEPCGDPPAGTGCTLLWATSANSEIISRNEGQ
jgi:type II secretory pathway pseudopilin PulG